MTYRICQVIFSTNRIEYLSRTLQAQKLLDFSDCEVDRIFIDDYPLNRNNNIIRSLVSSFGYNEIYLHEQNLGLSVTWTEFWNLIRDRNYDYIWHQEDDVEILEPVKITDLIELLKYDKELAQIVLTRQAWYPTDEPPTALESDNIFRQYRYVKGSQVFSPMASLYSIDCVRFDYNKHFGEFYPETNWNKINYNEGMIGVALFEKQGLVGCSIKNKHGQPLINHIGEYFVGKRVLPDEPHYDRFVNFDPEKRYNSKTGELYS